MSDNRGTEQERDPSRPVLEDDGAGDAYADEDEILGELDGLDELGELDALDEDSADLEDFDTLEEDEDWNAPGGQEDAF